MGDVSRNEIKWIEGYEVSKDQRNTSVTKHTVCTYVSYKLMIPREGGDETSNCVRQR